jgi:hypothetical protein
MYVRKVGSRVVYWEGLGVLLYLEYKISICTSSILRFEPKITVSD